MSASLDTQQTIRSLSQEGYKYGFVTDIEAETAPPGLDEDTVRFISAKKEEPEWLLEWRLAGVPRLARDDRSRNGPRSNSRRSISRRRPTTRRRSRRRRRNRSTRSIPNCCAPTKSSAFRCASARRWPASNSGVAVDAVFDSVSVATTFKAQLAEQGIIFCSFGEAVREHPELVRKYLGTVVPQNDNFYAALNSAVFSDGSFAYIPPGVRCPMELSTYFRINARNSGQFERTLLIADKGAYVSYLEGCTAPQRDENQLHAAVVELIAHEDAQIKYSTVQNWYPGDAEGKGGIYNFVTKRGACRGARAKISWTQVETGSAITWKYPSCILEGDNSVGEFYSVAITNNRQQADTGTKMIHIGRNTRSTIISKGISAGRGQNTYRGLVRVQPRAEGARNYTQCDSLLIGDRCGAHTVPYIEVRNPSARVEHEATTSKISDDQLFYCRQRGIKDEDALSLIVNGFCKEVLKELPMEFAVEAQKLLAVSLEGSVG